MSGPVDQGQTYRYRFPVKNASGVLANAGTVTVTITLPDGSTTAPTVVNTSTGIYDIAYTTSQVGTHDIKASATGGVLGTETDVWEDAFVVEEPKRLFIGLDEASDHLRATGVISSDPDREQLRRYCLDACSVVEDDLQRVIARRTIIDTFNGGRSVVHLRSMPVISITSVVEGSTTLVDGTGYVKDLALGSVFRGTSNGTFPFQDGIQNIVVTYVAGYANPPRTLRKAAKNIVQAMWQTSQQASHPLINEEFAASVLPGAIEGLSSAERSAYNRFKNLTGFA